MDTDRNNTESEIKMQASEPTCTCPTITGATMPGSTAAIRGGDDA